MCYALCTVRGRERVQQWKDGHRPGLVRKIEVDVGAPALHTSCVLPVLHYPNSAARECSPCMHTHPGVSTLRTLVMDCQQTLRCSLLSLRPCPSSPQLQPAQHLVRVDVLLCDECRAPQRPGGRPP